ncbi:MAG: hypothetical protein OSB64_07935, partial [Candidatus Marinimicrobia bacterium]|nr:hypothetical protein [Candidatus Neomarinimicrobiota bacterium]
MDTFSHALWGKGLFGYRGHRWMALFFGAMPDLFSFGILIIIRILSGEFQLGSPPPSETIPWWVYINYDISHSFVSALLCIGIVYRYRKDLAFAML